MWLKKGAGSSIAALHCSLYVALEREAAALCWGVCVWLLWSTSPFLIFLIREREPVHDIDLALPRSCDGSRDLLCDGYAFASGVWGSLAVCVEPVVGSRTVVRSSLPLLCVVFFSLRLLSSVYAGTTFHLQTCTNKKNSPLLPTTWISSICWSL